MKPETLTTLLAGHFVCPYAFPAAYEDLTQSGAAQEVDDWLSRLDKRLARLGDDGAFFVAPLQVHTNEQIAKVRSSLVNFRSTYGMLTEMIYLIRTANEGFRCVPGEFVQLADVTSKVNEDSTLVARLREMVIPGKDPRMTNFQLLKKMLERLSTDGYLVLANADTETYQVTGKIDHLHQVFRYIVENVPELNQGAAADGDEGEDQDDQQDDLLRRSGANDDGSLS